MKDEKGNLYIFEVIFAVMILLIAVFVINAVILSVPSPHYSESVKDFNTAQDIMEILAAKINSTDRTFLEDISYILAKNKNSKKSIEEASESSQNVFSKFKLDNYRFSENNVLNGKVLAESGDYSKAENVSVAVRNHGDYSYTLSIW